MGTALHTPRFTFLQLKEIQPHGWLLNQLKIQAAGLSGNLDKIWPDIRDSQWFGGCTDGWERVPYWLDGFIPLAWLLDDEDMKARAQRYMDYIMEHQAQDGWICPQSQGDRSRYDVWAMMLILKVLTVYHDATGDSRVEDVVRKALQALDRHIDGNTLFNWGQARWFECLISIWWLYDRTGEDWLLTLAVKLRSQGFDWQGLYQPWPYEKPDEKGRWSMMSHVVNNAMMLKAGVLLWRMTGQDAHLHCAEDMVRQLDTFHGMVTGVFSGDECLSGNSPVQGTELCAVGEYMYSLEHLLSITGDAYWGDRLEKIAYNALPATFSPDMWTHQYNQQVNQVQCSRQPYSVFYTNGGEANLFGLEPNYGCCTANLSQPWPKLALSTFMRSEDGLAAAVYAPCSIQTAIGAAQVSVQLDTKYPFGDTLHFTVNTDREVSFSLWLRIPSWAEGASLQLDGSEQPVTPGTFHRLERNWSGKTCFTLHLPMQPQVEARPNQLYAVVRGPLVYALPIGERWVRINEDMPGHEFPHCDYEVYPTTSWNYGLSLDTANPAGRFTLEERPLGDCPFSPAGAPVALRVKGRKVDWSMENQWAAPIPGMAWVAEEEEELRLIPYGCTNLRITEMPLVK